MADSERDVAGPSSDDVCVYLGSIDQRVERTLWQLAIEPKKDVVNELASEFDFEMLRNTRDILFVRAKERVRVAMLDWSWCGGTESPDNDVDPWRMINRRQVNLMGYDICDLYLYDTGMTTEFPSKLLRRKTLLCSDGIDGVNSVLVAAPEETISSNTEYVEGVGIVNGDVGVEERGTDISTREGHSRSNREDRPARSFFSKSM